jgi:hypothetical protein
MFGMHLSVSVPRFSFLNSTLVVCPMIGYAVSEQDLNIVDGYQAFTAPPAATAHWSHCRSGQPL